MDFLNLSDVKLESELLEPGTYDVVISEATVKSTKDGSGEYINAKMKVFTGEREGKTIYTMFNIKNQNQQAVDIGKKQLKGLLLAAGKDGNSLKSVGELVGIKVAAVVKTKSDSFGDKNIVSYFKPLSAKAVDASVPF